VAGGSPDVSRGQAVNLAAVFGCESEDAFPRKCSGRQLPASQRRRRRGEDGEDGEAKTAAMRTLAALMVCRSDAIVLAVLLSDVVVRPDWPTSRLSDSEARWTTR
jgi:hypothetical protein